MTTFQTPNPERSQGLDLRNPKRRASDFTALVQLGELPASDTLESAENRVGKGVQQHFNLTEAFVWHPLTGLANGAITQPVRGPASDGANWIMWALVGLDQNQIVLINFTIYATDPADRALYAAAAEKIAASVAPGPAKDTKPE